MRFALTVFGGGLLFLAPLSPAQSAPEGVTNANAAVAAAPEPSLVAAVPNLASAAPCQTPAQQSASVSGQSQQTAPNSAPTQCNTGAGATGAGAGESSGPQTSGGQASREQTQREKAEEEVKEQEKQRVEGIVPTFNVTYHHDAVPLTPGQKMNLSLHSSLDPFAFASAFAEAGYHEAANDLSGFPWGPEGYFERVGAAYLDTFDGTILSTGVVPIIFRQDPRYFRLGYGSARHRILYSLATNFIAKSDRTGKWQPNYGNTLGNLAAGALSNLYYPGGNSSFGLTLTNTMLQIGEGAGGSIFNEFWPDLSRKLLHKDPTHGLDAQAQAADRAARLAKQNQGQDQEQNQEQKQEQKQ